MIETSGVAVLALTRNNRMTGLVIGGNSLVALGYNPALLLGAHEYFVNALIQLLVAYKLFILPCGEYCGFV